MNRYLRSMPAALMIAFTFALIIAVGCSNDETPTGSSLPPTIEVSGILCNPLAPAPGDTARLTVRAEGQGTGATYEWQVEAGTLIGSTDISVEWAVPADPGIYTVMVRARIGSEIRQDTSWVMVRNCEAINAGIRYAFYPNIVDGSFCFVGTNDSLLSGTSFYGYHAYKQSLPPTQIDKLSTMYVNGGYDFKFYPDGVLAASITNGNPSFRLQPMNVVFYQYLTIIPPTLWSDNEYTGTTFRKNENLYPNATSNLQMAVWQRIVVGLTDDGKKDLVNIRFRYLMEPIQTLTTAKDSVFVYGAWNYTYWKNIKPTFTPDNANIIYFNDSTDTFEPCLIPMDGSVPNLMERRAFMVDARHGIFFYAGVSVSEQTIFQWNPVNSAELAFIDDNEQLCILDYVSETVEILATGLTEFVYSEDGKIAAVAEDGVYILEPGQAEAKRVFTKERATDGVIGINWSPGLDDQRLGFRMVRKGASTLESYAVLVIYSMTDDRWYYASPEIKPVMTSEPEVSYIWMRAIFDSVTGGMYVPVPLSTAGGRSVFYYSY